MKYRNLTNDILVSEVGYGTWGLGGKAYGHTDDDASVNLLKYSFDKGINFFDTADLYGRSESIVSKAFSGNRDKVVIATKGGTLPHSGFVMPQDFSGKYIEKALNKSLKVLGTDYIDLYQLHSPLINDLSDELFLTLEKFKSSGKVREIGVSTKSPEDAMNLIKKYNIKFLQVNYNMIDQRAKDIGLLDMASHNNVSIICRTPLVFGYLTGSMSGGEKLEDGDHRKNWPKDQLRMWADSTALFDKINNGKKRSQVQTALQFCLEHDSIKTVIPGMMKKSEIIENISIFDVEALSVDEFNKICNIYNSNTFYDNKAKSRGIQ